MFTKRRQRNEYPDVKLAGNRLSWNSHVKHLGNILSSDLSEQKEMVAKKGDFIGRVNSLQATLGHAPQDIIMPIFRSQCCHYYGCQAWDLSDRATHEFHRIWNRGVRRLLKLPYQTHTRFLPHLAEMPHPEADISRRFVKSLHKMLYSSNSLLEYISILGTQCADTIIGRNLKYIDQVCSRDDPVFCLNFKIKRLYCSQDDFCAIQAIKDLKDNAEQFLNYHDAHEFLQFLCIN